MVLGIIYLTNGMTIQENTHKPYYVKTFSQILEFYTLGSIINHVEQVKIGHIYRTVGLHNTVVRPIHY